MNKKTITSLTAFFRNEKKTALKRIIATACMLAFLLIVKISAQDLPLVNPSLTNSFFYNPSLAGSLSSSLGLVSVIHRESFRNVSGHPVCDIVGLHIPISNYRFGIGANLYIDRVNAAKTTYGSFSYAYHIPFDRYKKLSLGVSGSLSQIRLDYSKVQVLDKSEYDRLINKYVDRKFKVDFSLGVNYQAERLMVGGTINNLASSGIFHKKENTALFNYFSAFIKYNILLFHKSDQFEPYIAYRQLPLSPPQGDIGFHYSYRRHNSILQVNDTYFTGGFAVGTNLNTIFSLGVNLRNRIRLMYSYEISGRYNWDIGSTNEIILQYNFLNLTYPEWHTDYLRWDNLKHHLRWKLREKIK